jgi:predicted esterase
MKKIILFLTLLSLPLLSSSQEKIEIKRNTYTYTDTLQLDFYTIEKNTDKNRPLIVLVHGGGFSAGNRDNPTEASFCEKIASQGFAVASISYRLTRKDKSFGCDCPAKDKIETFVKASEDIANALIFLHSKKDDLIFDKNKSILVGSSAGGEAILNTAFMLNDYRFDHIKKIPLAAVISFSGALINSEYINEENAIPALFFHGLKDKLVPFSTAAHHYCSSDKDGYIILEGSKSISDKLKELNTSYILAYDPNGGHEWANLAYQEIDRINYFIEEIVLNKRFIQLTYMLE